jgi:hypothetical protein
MLDHKLLLRLYGSLIGAMLTLPVIITPVNAAQFDFGALEPSTLYGIDLVAPVGAA